MTDYRTVLIRAISGTENPGQPRNLSVRCRYLQVDRERNRINDVNIVLGHSRHHKVHARLRKATAKVVANGEVVGGDPVFFRVSNFAQPASHPMAGGREFSLFSGYNQKENRHTNYGLLLLKQLYEENLRFLGEALDGITGGDGDSVIGVKFRQQQNRSGAIPDGVITQQPFTLFVETASERAEALDGMVWSEFD